MSKSNVLLYQKKAERQEAKNQVNSRVTINAFIEKYSEWMRVVNFSETTIEGKKDDLARFALWCEERSVDEITQVTPSLLERYQKYLYYYRNAVTGRPLSTSSQSGELSTIRTFFKWLARKHFLSYNPASEVDLPKVSKQLPRFVLTS